MRYTNGADGAQGRITSPWGTPDQPNWPTRGRRGPRWGLLVLPTVVLPLGIGALVIGGVLAAHPDPDISVQPGLGLAVTPARQLALVPYERDGEAGVLGPFGGDLWQKRLVAVDLATGERVWDVRLSSELIWQARVLVAGDTHAYLATDDGLMIVDLTDGSVAVAPDEIPGIGADHIASGAAYGYDSARGAVVAMDVRGAYHTIPVGELAAAPADESTSAAWAGRLTDGPMSVESQALTAEDASAGEAGHLTLEPTTDAAPSGALLLDGPDGGRELGGRVFREPEILLADGTHVATAAPVGVGVDPGNAAASAPTVEGLLTEGPLADSGLLPDGVAGELEEQLARALEGGPAALPWPPDRASPRENAGSEPVPLALGAERGHVLVQEAADAVGDRYRLVVVSLETGEVLASRTMRSPAGPALTSPDGVTVLPVTDEDAEFPAHDGLLLVAPDGTLTDVTVGGTDFFGNVD
ncbi:hypothetical protein SAMN06297387_11097 [Streptomyces zhaozhouensis]|uniref:PQQ-like domain-containing protein n=1 Tax=Streptomyces zhaozhouensis TaxID=1300267 RepID=A0A286DXH4_9ACTN|nr:PA2928 family protein [Streptomyces zhaozhouensis]SOD63365.1 hypothetical protein SAMN06297387_11097 [Streptomyces zhaozhouensis]